MVNDLLITSVWSTHQKVKKESTSTCFVLLKACFVVLGTITIKPFISINNRSFTKDIIRNKQNAQKIHFLYLNSAMVWSMIQKLMKFLDMHQNIMGSNLANTLSFHHLLQKSIPYDLHNPGDKRTKRHKYLLVSDNEFPLKCPPATTYINFIFHFGEMPWLSGSATLNQRAVAGTVNYKFITMPLTVQLGTKVFCCWEET